MNQKKHQKNPAVEDKIIIDLQRKGYSEKAAIALVAKTKLPEDILLRLLNEAPLKKIETIALKDVALKLIEVSKCVQYEKKLYRKMKELDVFEIAQTKKYMTTHFANLLKEQKHFLMAKKTYHQKLSSKKHLDFQIAQDANFDVAAYVNFTVPYLVHKFVKQQLLIHQSLPIKLRKSQDKFQLYWTKYYGVPFNAQKQEIAKLMEKNSQQLTSIVWKLSKTFCLTPESMQRIVYCEEIFIWIEIFKILQKKPQILATIKMMLVQKGARINQEVLHEINRWQKTSSH